MAKEKFEDFSLDKLRKRKKISVVLLWVLIVTVILSIIIMLRDFIGGERQLNISLLGTASPCLFFALYFYFGIKKINGEISRRKSQ